MDSPLNEWVSTADADSNHTQWITTNTQRYYRSNSYNPNQIGVWKNIKDNWNWDENEPFSGILFVFDHVDHSTDGLPPIVSFESRVPIEFKLSHALRKEASNHPKVHPDVSKSAHQTGITPHDAAKDLLDGGLMAAGSYAAGKVASWYRNLGGARGAIQAIGDGVAEAGPELAELLPALL